MDNFNVYKDIQARTKGEIYIGVVGPVRTGKSTFIKRFMELAVLPAMEDESLKAVSTDELPQSAGGKTVMTTEPKFIPKEAVQITLGDGIQAKVRLIDCVGYMVDGAAGHVENGEERMVKTPWSEKEIPFIPGGPDRHQESHRGSFYHWHCSDYGRLCWGIKALCLYRCGKTDCR